MQKFRPEENLIYYSVWLLSRELLSKFYCNYFKHSE